MNLRHVLSIDNFILSEVEYLIERGSFYLNNGNRNLLSGKLFYNVFFEESTRTIAAFATAAVKLGGSVISLNMKDSSITKGETEIDSIKNIEAMGARFIAIRHPHNMTAHICAKHTESAIILNGGDGCNEHPFQALGDLLTIYHEVAQCDFERLRSLKIVFCGDIKHSRVAHSLIKLFFLIGMKDLHLVAPPELTSRYDLTHTGLQYSHRLDDSIENADVVLSFRYKKEYDGFSSGTIDDFGKFYQINHSVIKKARTNVKIMHPGPVNRGVEMSGALADDRSYSLILKQVSYGVAMRQAVLEFCDRESH